MYRLIAAAAVAVLAPLLGAAGSAGANPLFDDVALDVGVNVFYPGEGLGQTALGQVAGGVCWADFDGDGFDDLFFTKASLNDTVLQRLHRPKSQLFRANGDGTFADVSAGSGVAIESWGAGCSAADYDGDGDTDLYYSGYGESSLFRNDGAMRFSNVTVEAGVSMRGRCPGFPCFTTGSSWQDVNRDGCLDLYVSNYGNLSYVWSSPPNLPGQANTYFQSDCNGGFVDRTYEVNLDDDPAPNHSRTFMPMWCDYDADGLVDVFITSDGAPDSLMKQRPDGTFVDVAPELGVDDVRAGMGLEFDDVDGDGDCDLYFTHYVAQHNGFYVNNGNGTFTDRSGEGNLSSDLWDLGWGTGFLDLDLDGLKDIYVVNGHTYFFETGANFSRRVYLQQANGEFRDVSNTTGPGMSMERTSRGSGWSDYDFDGDLDVVVLNVNNQTSNLLRASNVSGTWLEVQLRDPGSANRFAVGAKVRVDPDGPPRAQWRVNHAGASFIGTNSMTLHFGLGGAESASVRVEWPDGSTSEFPDVRANRVVRATRGSPSLEEDVLAPTTALAVAGARRGAWVVEPATVWLAASDRGVTRVSGVASTEYAVDDGPWTAYAHAFTLGDGAHVVRYRSRDAAGNAEPVRTDVVRVDGTPPAVSAALTGPAMGGWFTARPTLTIAASDATSGVTSRWTREAGGPAAPPVEDGAWAPYDGPAEVPPGDGPREVLARAVDAAGHEAVASTGAFRVDASPPKARLVVAAGPSLARADVLDVTSGTTLAIAADDGAGSGVASIEYRVDGGAWRAFDGAIAFAGPDRAILLEFRATDAVGHASDPVVVRLFLDDARAPPVSLDAPARRRAYAGDAIAVNAAAVPGAVVASGEAALGEPSGFAIVVGDAPVLATVGQDVSGVAWTRVLVDGVERARATGDRLSWTWSSAAERPGFHDLSVQAADGRGNVGRADVRVLVAGPGLP